MRRPERVAELLREEISQIVGYELDDRRVETVTVTEVRVSDNLRDAKVFVLVEGTDEEINAALIALRNAAPYIRKQVAFALDLRHAPALHFARDTVEERANRIESLLSEIKPTERHQEG
ncbi:MAG TPA: 30S ribosome-binding factor RbfA [Pyrinomonadaceae bacterium]|jgi:ribosome-binding factor A